MQIKCDAAIIKAERCLIFDKTAILLLLILYSVCENTII
jgi:hypothetical protein